MTRMLRPALTALLVLGICLVATAKNAQAGEVSLNGHPVMSCYLTLNGPIEAGDAKALKATIERFLKTTSRMDYPSVPRVCLNSEGGSYDAALHIIETLGGQFATAIGPGDTCADACALLFMSGRAGDGGTVDTEQGGRIVHPKGVLRLGEDGTPKMRLDQVAKVLSLKEAYDLPAEVIAAMIDDAPLAPTLNTVGEATRWQIRVAPTVAPETLTPLATWLACTNIAEPVLPKLRFVDWDFYDKDYPREDTPVVLKRTFFEGRVALRLNSNNRITCEVTYFGSSVLPTGQIGVLRLTLGKDDGVELYRSIYGASFFTPDTPISTLARDADDTPQAASVAETSAPQRTERPGTCGRIESGRLVWHQECTRTERIAPFEDMTTLTTTTFAFADGSVITATATGEFRRYWPRNFEPQYTFDGKMAEFYGDGLPDEGDDGNEPGADEACRLVTEGQSEWCYTSFWHTPDNSETFIFIAEEDYGSGLSYAYD